jgi:hypothetical protein
MPLRTFDAAELVVLPYGLSARGCVTLATELVTAAKPYVEKLPAPVKQPLDEVEAKGAALSVEVGRFVPPELTVAAKKADRAVDTSFSICLRILQQRARLPDEYPAGTKARAMIGRLFPDRLAFVHHPYKIEWQETAGILAAIEDDKLEPELTELVGADVVAFMRKSHAGYGEALGVTGARVAPFEPAVREKMDELTQAIRVYVVRVSASVDAKDPATGARAKALLAPLAEWQSGPEGSGGGSGPPAGGATGPG